MVNRNKMPAPYVGITGFKTREEIDRVSKMLDKFEYPEKGIKTMFGILCSDKRIDNSKKHGRRSPSIEDLFGLTDYLGGHIIPMIHYHSKDKERLFSDVCAIFKEQGMYWQGNCNAIQINQDWPLVSEIEKIYSKYAGMQIVLQIPQRALSKYKKAREYLNLVDYCLIDPSGGEGKDLSERDLEVALEVAEMLPGTRIGIAGGLCGGNLRPICEKFKSMYDDGFCIDAEGKLRTWHNESLNFEKVENYLREYDKFISSSPFF